MKRREVEDLLRHLEKADKPQIIATLRRAAANTGGAWGMQLEGFASRLERRAPFDTKMLTLLQPKDNKQPSMAAFEERIPIRGIKDIILPLKIRCEVEDMLREHRAQEKLAEHGLTPPSKALLIGPSGSGKTMLAEVVAFETKKPLYILRMGALLDSYLGNTIRNIENSFAAIALADGVFLFDEFDALATARNEKNEVNEMRRALNALLICFENHKGPAIVIATTNREQSMDSAFRRRFDSVWELVGPDHKGRADIILETTVRHRLPQPGSLITKLATLLDGMSFDECETITRKLLREALMAGKTELNITNLSETSRYKVGAPTP